MKRLFWILLVIMSIFWGSLAFAANPELSTIPVDTTDTYLLVTNNFNHGLVLVDQRNGKTVTITEGRNAGYYATISADQRYVCYKSFLPENERYLQKSMLYDIKTGENIALTEWNTLVGTPTVAQNGTIAYTVGNELLILDANFNQKDSLNLGYHVNLLDFSSDGQKLTFNDANGQIVVLNLADKGMKIVDSKNSFWGPKFSPNSDKIMSPTVDGYTALVDVQSGEIKALDKGQALGWIDNDTIAYLDKKINEKDAKVEKSDLIMLNTVDLSKKVVTVNNGDATVALKAGDIALSRQGQLEMGQVRDQKLNTWSNKIKVPVPAQDIFADVVQNEAVEVQSSDFSIQAIYDGVYSRYLTGMQYIHQVYDTPNNFNGHWACGASSALMAIQYYGVLSSHPITVSVPYSHTSNYGWYVSSVYTYGRTFNIYGADPNGTLFAGGYGYIIQNDWADTKGHMAEYIQYHGRGSSVDWSPYWSEFQTEINNNHPFVVLTSLTSSGHYITARGYYWDQHSGVFNDPYGNKNSGYMNYSGTLVGYDWPGYNNGYSNLNTVHCFIYCR